MGEGSGSTSPRIHRLRGSRDKGATFLRHLEPLQKPLEVFCRRMLRDRSLVEDVIHNAILKAFQKFDRFSEGTDFKAWIFRFVTLEILNQNRKSTLAWQSEFPADLPVENS